jgi:protein-disulfide isomerase
VPRTKQSVLTLIVVAAVLIVAVLVAISQAGGSSGGGATGLGGVTQARALFRGIPQQGIALGDPRAPVTLTEFADLQCPFCRQYTEAVLPTLVKRYVRTGKVRMIFQALAFIGPDSARAPAWRRRRGSRTGCGSSPTSCTETRGRRTAGT